MAARDIEKECIYENFDLLLREKTMVWKFKASLKRDYSSK